MNKKVKRENIAMPERTEQMHLSATAALAHRLEVLLANERMPNGTSGAAAVHAVVMAELLATERPVTDLDAISDERLIQACRDLAMALNIGGMVSFGLPFGTTAVSPEPGMLSIGEQYFVLDVGHAGLHPTESVRHDAHGLNFERLVTLIGNKTRNLACRRLGIPASTVAEHSSHVLHFAPLAEAGGVVLQRQSYDTGVDIFCAALPWQIEALADSMVAEMKTLWRRRVEIAARVHEVRLAATAGLRAEPECQARVKAISILSDDLESVPPALYIEYRAINEALRPGTVLEYVPEFRILHGPLPPPCQILSRVRAREQLAQLGATGWIDELAAAVVRTAPQGCATVLTNLATRFSTTVEFPTRGGVLCAQLYWRDGKITVEAWLPGKLLWMSNKLKLQAEVLPEALVQGLQGRRLSDVVELPFGGDLTIIDARLAPYGLALTFDLGEMLVNCEQGSILGSSR